MKLKREDLLCSLEFVAAGLSSREFIQQSTCFIVKNGRIRTFNDEVSCSCKSPLEGEIAIPAAPMLDLLRKMDEEYVLVDVGDSELSIKGKKKMAGIGFESEVTLPIEEVEIPTEWRDIPEHFLDGVKAVSSCACTDDSQLMLACVHITSDRIECCDRYQFARYSLNTGFEKEVLVRADSLKLISVLGPSHVAETKAWLHFKNQFDVVYSFRKTDDTYPDLDNIFAAEDGQNTTIPNGIEDVVKKTEIFVANREGSYIVVDLKSDSVVVEGRGIFGWYKEKLDITYDGKPVRFRIPPKLLVSIGKKSRKCTITEKKLYAYMGDLQFVTSTEIEDR